MWKKKKKKKKKIQKNKINFKKKNLVGLLYTCIKIQNEQKKIIFKIHKKRQKKKKEKSKKIKVLWKKQTGWVFFKKLSVFNRL